MSIIATILVGLLNIFGYIFNSKFNKVWFSLLFLIMIILMGGNNYNPDIFAYMYNYEFRSESSDYGYQFLKNIFIYFGLSYEQFKLCLTIFCFFLINNTVRRFIKYPSLFYLLYFIYPFFIDIVQVRNFFIMSILIYSLPYLITDLKKDKIKFFILTLFASTIQLTAIVYLPLIMISKIKRYKYLRFILLTIIIFCTMIALNKSLLSTFTLNIIAVLGNFDERISNYGFIQTNYGFILLWAIQFTNFLMIYWSKKKCGENKLLLKHEQNKYIETVYYINLIAFLFLPFYVFQVTFSRFMRNIIPINLIAFLITDSIYKKNKYIFRVVYISYQVMLLYIDLNYLYPNIILNDFFEYNWIFN